MTERTITLDGDTWRVLSVGAFLNGKVFCHMVSTTRSTKQIGDWVDVDLAAAGFAHIYKRRGEWIVEVSRTPDLSSGIIDHLAAFSNIRDAKDAARAKGYVIHNA